MLRPVDIRQVEVPSNNKFWEFLTFCQFFDVVMQCLKTAWVWVSVSVEWADIEVRISDHLKPSNVCISWSLAMYASLDGSLYVACISLGKSVMEVHRSFCLSCSVWLEKIHDACQSPTIMASEILWSTTGDVATCAQNPHAGTLKDKPYEINASCAVAGNSRGEMGQ